jgi:hypothetical protein
MDFMEAERMVAYLALGYRLPQVRRFLCAGRWWFADADSDLMTYPGQLVRATLTVATGPGGQKPLSSEFGQ